MATKEQCSMYDKCKFVEWRKKEVTVAKALPSDGDCEIKMEACCRLDPNTDVDIGEYGPAVENEFFTGMPMYENDNERPPRLTPGSASR